MKLRSSNFLQMLFTNFLAQSAILIFGSLEVIGPSMVTIQAYSKDLPSDLICQGRCVKGGTALMFYGSLSLLAIGAGGVKGSFSGTRCRSVQRQGSERSKAARKLFQTSVLQIPVIPLVFMMFLMPIYEFVIVPFARKITGHPSGITQLKCVGVGLVLSIISKGVAGVIEVKRRDQSINDPSNPISLFWLSFRYGIFGLADMFSIVGLMEFFCKEAMKSLATSFAWLSLSFRYFLSTAFVNILNSVTEKITSSEKGWIHGDNLNANNLISSTGSLLSLPPFVGY